MPEIVETDNGPRTHNRSNGTVLQSHCSPHGRTAEAMPLCCNPTVAHTVATAISVTSQGRTCTRQSPWARKCSAVVMVSRAFITDSWTSAFDDSPHLAIMPTTWTQPQNDRKISKKSRRASKGWMIKGRGTCELFKSC
jgi:hypothetical protein